MSFSLYRYFFSVNHLKVSFRLDTPLPLKTQMCNSENQVDSLIQQEHLEKRVFTPTRCCQLQTLPSFVSCAADKKYKEEN